MINQRNTLLRLEVDNNKIIFENDALVAALKANKSITYLNLSHNRLDKNGLILLAETLAANPRISAINLSYCAYYNIYSDFLHRLSAIPSLQHRLSLSRQSFTEEEFAVLSQTLAKNPCLTRLSFCDVAANAGPTKRRGLCQAFTSSHNIVQLNISGTDHSKSQLKILTSWLKSNASLTHLTMRSINLCSNSIDSLCGALRVNTTLIYLDLALNFIGTVGAKKIGIALAKNHSLLQLKLAQNFIGSGGVDFIVNSLCKHPSITKLNIRDNAFGADGILNALPLLVAKPNLVLTILGKHLQGNTGVEYLQQALIKYLPRIELCNL